MNDDIGEQKTCVEASRRTPAPGEVPPIPDHQLLRKIGSGSYGEVWLARNVMGTHRAVKVIYRSRFSSDRPFDREFKGVQNFDPISRSHPGLVNVLHVGRNDQAGYFYYVMELADDATVGQASRLPSLPSSQPSPGTVIHAEDAKTGQQENGTSPSIANRNSEIENPGAYIPKTLARELHERGRLPVAECLRLSLLLADALSHLHKHRLVHRDIKPSNIIFVNGVPKLADIGLVVQLDQSISGGSPGYIPPEGPGTPQADVFSLGKVIYELCTGKDRFDFPELPTDLDKMEDGPTLVSLSDVLAKACAEDVRQRYQTAAEFHADLAALQKGEPPKARPAESFLSWLGPAHSNPWRWATSVAAVVVLALLALWLVNNSKREAGKTVAAASQLTPSTLKLPPNVVPLSAADVLKIAYASQPPSAPANAVRPQLQFELVAARQGASGFTPVQDGDSLRSEADDYGIVARALSAGWLYVFQVDSSGNKEWLFPQNPSSAHSSGSNPLADGQMIQIPSTNLERALFLDRNTGVEHVYAVFSGARWPELENALAKPNRAPEQSGPTLLARRVEQPNGLLMRGVGGTRTNAAAIDLSGALGRLHPSQGQSLNVASPVMEATRSFLVLERWFRHTD
ncbi:MAG: protein kinase [Verrucomicrobia bacterium]|nr:protein kinase [Verrucomicrobiota bacterium]